MIITPKDIEARVEKLKNYKEACNIATELAPLVNSKIVMEHAAQALVLAFYKKLPVNMAFELAITIGIAIGVGATLDKVETSKLEELWTK